MRTSRAFPIGIRNRRPVNGKTAGTGVWDDDFLMKNSLLGLAILLGVIWVVARVVLAVSGLFLHLLGMAALALLAVWAFRQFSGR